MIVGLMMSITIPVWIAVPLFQVGQMIFIEVIPLVLVILIGLYGAGCFFGNVREEEGE